MSWFMCGHNSPDWGSGWGLLAEWNTCLAQAVPLGNSTQLVWLGSGLNRPCLCHQRSRSSHTHVNCAHTRETDWNLPASFPIKHWILLRQIKGWCCFVRWVSMSNERARGEAFNESQFSCRRRRGPFAESWLLGAEKWVTVHALKINTVQMHWLCIV